MKVHITLSDQNGVVFEGEAELAPAGTPRKTSRKTPTPSPSNRTGNCTPAVPIDFAVNERAFMKAHAEGLSGPKRFALVLAYLTKGQVGKELELGEVQKHWSKMKTLLGNFNRKYTNDAKESGWVDSKKKGVYVLTSAWKGALT